MFSWFPCIRIFLAQVEVDEFTKSVLANPENQDMARRQERQKFVANPLNAIDQEVRWELSEIPDFNNCSFCSSTPRLVLQKCLWFKWPRAQWEVPAPSSPRSTCLPSYFAFHRRSLLEWLSWPKPLLWQYFRDLWSPAGIYLRIRTTIERCTKKCD